MSQMRQHAPLSPMGQGFISSARLKTVVQPFSRATSIISIAAGSILFISGMRLLLV
jgi:uncharacterized protein YhhL (DUF1145 family)